MKGVNIFKDSGGAIIVFIEVPGGEVIIVMQLFSGDVFERCFRPQH